MNTITAKQIKEYYDKIRIWLLNTKRYEVYDSFRNNNKVLSSYKTTAEKSIQLDKLINHCYDEIGECI
jgi:uncharacterized protein YqeY